MQFFTNCRYGGNKSVNEILWSSKSVAKEKKPWVAWKAWIQLSETFVH